MSLISLQQKLVDLLLTNDELRESLPSTPWHPPIWAEVVSQIKNRIDENPGVIEDDNRLRDWYDSYRLFISTQK